MFSLNLDRCHSRKSTVQPIFKRFINVFLRELCLENLVSKFLEHFPCSWIIGQAFPSEDAFSLQYPSVWLLRMS